MDACPFTSLAIPATMKIAASTSLTASSANSVNVNTWQLARLPRPRRRDIDADKARALDGARDEAGIARRVEELLDHIEERLVALPDDDGLLHAVEIVGQQAEIRVALGQLVETLAIGAVGLDLAGAQHLWHPIGVAVAIALQF